MRRRNGDRQVMTSLIAWIGTVVYGWAGVPATCGN